MFVGFFFHLRAVGLKVTLPEWQTLLTALERGHGECSLGGFYVLGRAICCRTEMDYDTFDVAFAEYFEGLDHVQKEHPELGQSLEEWLKNPLASKLLSEEEKKQVATLDWGELQQKLMERLQEQKARHDGGSKWIGTGGTSPFGHSGWNPQGIRVGGESSTGHAVQIATKRAYKNFRRDAILDTRQIGLALRRLNHWVREGHPTELDLEASIHATAKNAGELELVFRPEHRNHLKLLLLMDVGGSMTYYTTLCEQLFSAAHQSSHFKEFRSYFFHNCPYDFLYTDMENVTKVSTLRILKEFDSTWMLMVLGDAAMAPTELTEVGGAIDFYEHNKEPGLVWLDRMRRHFSCAVWLNPEPQAFWHRPSNRMVRTIFREMFPLSLEGLDDAIRSLKTQKMRQG
jgi:uncharacterized protein with von Willebrand factor type A (vWA) domain